MTTLLPRLSPPPDAIEEHPRRSGLLYGWVDRHRLSLIVLSILLVLIGLAHGWNMIGWPGRINDDEGTYVAQAWAVLNQQTLSHYTYWYDHPPLGWITIAGYAWLTDGFGRTETALMVGREVMLLCNLVSCGLLFMLARRLGVHRVFATLAVVAFAFSPLAMQFHRMVFLDNLAVAWILASLVFAVSPRKSLIASLGCGICAAGAVLTKETAALLIPFAFWALLQHSDRRLRLWNLILSVGIAGLIVMAYPIYAILKNELFEGPGHVSLLWAVKWQLFDRPGSGSLLDPDSGSFALARSWTDTDPWLVLVGIGLAVPAMCIKHLRPIAGALLLQVIATFRPGYLPFPYVISVLPFAALLIGAVADAAWHRTPARTATQGRATRVIRLGGRSLVIGALAAIVVLATPGWARGLQRSTTTDLTGATAAATDWIERNIPKDAVLIVDGYLWTDLTLRGYQNNIWFYKADLDPAVRTQYLSAGYTAIDYVALGTLADSTLRELPTVAEAITHSTVTASFGNGEVVIRKVDDAGT